MDKDDKGIRLQVFLAHAGIASRRKCEEYIAQGLVTINGKRTDSKTVYFVKKDDFVKFNDKTVRQEKNKVYVALHKPTQYMCTNSDPQGRPLAIDLLKPIFHERLYNVGRLDYLTSGLILFTNDGDFAKKVSHPSSQIEKEYIVTTKKEIPEGLLMAFKKGLYTNGELLKLKSYTLIGPHTAKIILEEGKNREIRKVFQSENIYIKKVHRVRIGKITINGIAPGHFRKLSEGEVKALLKEAENKKPQYKKQKKREV